MTRNYKTGPRRSRRRPDPANQGGSTRTINAWIQQTASLGENAFEVVLRGAQWHSGSQLAPNSLYLTGIDLGIEVSAQNGVFGPTSVTLNESMGDLTISFAGPSLGPGTATLRLPPNNLGIRGRDGSWMALWLADYELVI